MDYLHTFSTKGKMFISNAFSKLIIKYRKWKFKRGSSLPEICSGPSDGTEKTANRCILNYNLQNRKRYYFHSHHLLISAICSMDIMLHNAHHHSSRVTAHSGFFRGPGTRTGLAQGPKTWQTTWGSNPRFQGSVSSGEVIVIQDSSIQKYITDCY